MTDETPNPTAPEPERPVEPRPGPAPHARPGPAPLPPPTRRPSSADTAPRRPEYRGAELDPERGPGLGCFWFQVIVLGFFIVIIPVGLKLNWPFELLAILLFVVIGLLLLTGQTVIFLLRLVAADRRARGRRRPLASASKTVGELEDEARSAGGRRPTPRPRRIRPRPTHPRRMRPGRMRPRHRARRVRGRGVRGRAESAPTPPPTPGADAAPAAADAAPTPPPTPPPPRPPRPKASPAIPCRRRTRPAGRRPTRRNPIPACDNRPRARHPGRAAR